MKGQVTINKEEVLKLVSDWLKGKVFEGNVYIESMSAKTYGALEIEVYFSNEPLEESPEETEEKGDA